MSSFYQIRGESNNDLGKYILNGKLNYLKKSTNISFAITVGRHFLNSPRRRHWNVVVQILRCIKGLPGQGLADMDKSNANEYWEDPE